MPCASNGPLQQVVMGCVIKVVIVRILVVIVVLCVNWVVVVIIWHQLTLEYPLAHQWQCLPNLAAAPVAVVVVMPCCSGGVPVLPPLLW